MTRTLAALEAGGHQSHAAVFRETFTRTGAWEDYARATFEAHASTYSDQPGKLRFLQYVTAASKPWWEVRVGRGAILL